MMIVHTSCDGEQSIFDVWRSEGRKPVDEGNKVRKVIEFLASGHSSLI